MKNSLVIWLILVEPITEFWSNYWRISLNVQLHRLYTEYVEFFDCGILILHFKDFDQNSSVFQSENLMTMKFIWNSTKLQEKFNQYSDQKIIWPRNSYETLENYRKSLDIPKIPTSAYSSKTFSSLFCISFSGER